MPSATVNDFFIALTSDANSKENLEKVYSGLSSFVRAFDNDKSIRLCLINDIYPSSVKNDLISQIVAECESTRKFLEVVIEFNLLKSFVESREFFLKKLRKLLGKVKIEVITINVEEKQKLDLIKSKLEEIWGNNLEISFKENPEILGGIVLQVEDKYFDGSILGKVNELKKINLKGEFNV
jgi:F-type H+-transporting ATPase subunit delta